MNTKNVIRNSLALATFLLCFKAIGGQQLRGTLDYEQAANSGNHNQNIEANNHVIDHRKQHSSDIFDASFGISIQDIDSNNPRPRIIGGSPSNPGDFPYYVDLGGCGGSLIAPSVVLSAGT